MRLLGLVLLTLLSLVIARRSFRADDSHNDAQQQNHELSKTLEVSAEAREGLIPWVFRNSTYAVRRAAAWRQVGPLYARRTASGPKADQLPLKDGAGGVWGVATRRNVLRGAAAIAGGLAAVGGVATAADAEDQRQYFQRFPTLFAPLYGEASRRTIKRQIGKDIWALEQNLELGPLQTPLRCVVVRLENGSLWVHAPLAPTNEFFELVESCGHGGSSVAHVVVPTYALEHKVFVKDALLRWPDARLWTSPGQFSFPKRSVSDEFVWGRSVSGVLSGSDEDAALPTVPWAKEIQYETLKAGTFMIAGSPTTFYETAFFSPSEQISHRHRLLGPGSTDGCGAE